MKGRRNSTPRVELHMGEPAVFVPLQDGTEAVTTPEGFAAVLAAGCPGTWTLDSSGIGKPTYVRVGEPRGYGARGKLRSVAALISGVSHDEQTTYRNGDRRDLRPCNLVREPRRGRRQGRALDMDRDDL